MAKFKIQLEGPDGLIDVVVEGRDSFVQAIFPVLKAGADALLASPEIFVENLVEANAELALAAEAIESGHNFRGELFRFTVTPKQKQNRAASIVQPELFS